MLFQYKAQRSSGEIFEDTREAADKYVLYREVKKEGNVVISATAASKKKSFDLKKINNLFGRVKIHEKILFARNLGSMIEAGLSVTRALSVMERQTRNKKLQKVLQDLSESVSRGIPLSDAIKNQEDVFPAFFVFMVKAGEESGNLSESLKLVGNQLEKVYLLQKKLKGALIYPVIIVIVMLLISILMLVYIVPTLSATFKELGAELPWSTKVVVSVSDFLKEDSILAFGIFLVVGASFWAFFKSKWGISQFDRLILRFPIIGSLVKETNAARTARTLSSLLSSGVDVVVAMNITSDVMQNVHYKAVLKSGQGIIEKGKTISSIFTENEHLYPIFVGEMISVGEETGKLPQMLLEVANFYETEVDQKTKDMSTIIEPFLMVFIGAVVGFFALAMIMPTYSLVNNI